MKKLSVLALLATALYADAQPDPTTPPPATQTTPTSDTQQAPVVVEQPAVNHNEYGSSVLTEYKLAYFRISDRKMRHIYDKGLLDMQLTSSFCFWKPLYVYTGIEYIGANGRVPKTHEKRKIRMVPVSLGVQYIQPITFDFKYYLTMGGRYFFVHQWNHSTRLTHHGLGGFANTGFLYHLSEHVVVDFFGEYSYKRMHFHKLGGSTQVGGLILGAGVGYFW